MFPMFNVQRAPPAGFLAANLAGAPSAFHVPGAAPTPNSPPVAAMAIDPTSPFLPTTMAQHAALLTLHAAAAAHAAAVASSTTPTSPFSMPSSPNGTMGIGGVLIPLASPHERHTSQNLAIQHIQQQHQHQHHQHQHHVQQMSPISVTCPDRPIKAGSPISTSSSTVSGQNATPISPGICSICSDRATGKHYGSNSCDGCKGFFRRTIRKKQTYVCRFTRSCVIDKDKRNTCRHCRFKKCLDAGMRREAVQNERDRITTKRSRQQTTSTDDTGLGDDSELVHKVSITSSVCASPPASSNSTLLVLLQAEKVASQLRSSVITRSMKAETVEPSDPERDASSPSADASNASRLATIGDLSDAIQQQLLLLVEWAKLLPPFFDLPLEDQVALLRAYSAQHLLLGVARRSLPYKDVLLLSNDACIPRSHSSELHDVNHVIVRLLDELVEPMREIQLDDTEYACVKALLFFNPSAFGLHNKTDVKATRRRVLEALQSYVNEKRVPDDRVRFGNILLLLPPLQAMSQQFIEDLQLATLFGMARFDKLLEELLLAAAEPLSAPFLVDGISAVANKVAGGLINLVNGNTGSTEDATKHYPEPPHPPSR